MAGKKVLNRKTKKISDIFVFSKKEYFDNLSENEKKDLISNCSLLFSNPALKVICDELYSREVVAAISDTSNFEQVVEKRGMILGLATLFETIEGFHMEYLDAVKKQEDFDHHSIF